MARATFRSRRDASRCWLQNPASRHLPIYGISRDGDHPKNGVVGQCQEEGPTGNGSRNERPRSGLKQHFGKLGGLGLSRRDSCCVLLRPAIGMPSLRGSCCASLPEFEACCRNHRLTNELYAMPRKHHAEARTLLCAVPYAETQSASRLFVQSSLTVIGNWHPRQWSVWLTTELNPITIKPERRFS